MTGKQKCKILKQIRRQIAEKNDIRYVTEECTHKGNCRGTCPKCEWEVRMLERELEKRRRSGRKVVLAGISASFLLTSCSPIDAVKEIFSSAVHPLEGDVMMETTDGAIAESATPGETVPDVLEGDVIAPETLAGEPAVPEPEMEEEEVEPVVTAGILPPYDETETCEISEEEEYVLEGDPIDPAAEDPS